MLELEAAGVDPVRGECPEHERVVGIRAVAESNQHAARLTQQEDLAGRCSSPGRDGRSLARTQGASIAEAIGATEDAASGRAARPGDTDTVLPSPPDIP